MLEGVKRVFKDIFDTLKKEAGELKISQESFDFNTQIFSENFVDLKIIEFDADKLQKEMEIKSVSEIGEEVEILEVEGPNRIVSILEEEITNDLSVEQLPILLNNPKINDFLLPEYGQIKIFLPEEAFDINELILYSEFEDISSRILTQEVAFNPGIMSFFSIFSTIPVRRKPAPRKDYTDEEIKKALKFVLDRIPENTKLKFSGVFRDVPINKIKQISFNYGDMLFTINSQNMKEMIILDVLIMKDEKAGKYYVGPVVRKI